MRYKRKGTPVSTPIEPIGSIGDTPSGKCVKLPIELDKEVRVTATLFNESKDQIVEKAVRTYLADIKVRQACLDGTIQDQELCKCHQV